jgi:signal transduction histidine kinase
MELFPTLLHVYENDDPSQAFFAMAEALRPSIPLRCALNVRSADRAVRDCWPEAVELSADFIDTALHVLRPEVFPLGSEFPFDANRFPTAEALILPIRRAEERLAACILIADTGAFGEDLQPWEQITRALEHSEARHERISNAEKRCAELQRRVEETEALHTLGLSANRTLDVAEVLNLVARVTRTLLGAHYVTVNTVDRGMTYSVASVGIRNAQASLEDYHLARAIVEAEKPLVIGGGNGRPEVENFPFHASEGMKVGLGIPLSLFGDTFGALVVGYRRDYEVTPRDIRLALTLAGHAAVAISNARLHETVEERSRQLQAANEELNRITLEKERFFASINHELRNPVGAILGYHTLLLDGTVGELPASTIPFVQKANRAAKTLQTLVDDILDLSKLAAGRMDLELRPVTVEEIVAGVMNTIDPLARQRGVEVRVELAGDLPPLSTDAGRAQQILVNLVSNAVKFTGDGGVDLTAATTAATADGEGDSVGSGMIEIRVTDSGPGIAPDDLTRIFEEYEQVKGTKGGTGLGLPISRRLARALGGELWAESATGAGSTFILRLPAAPVPPPDTDAVPPSVQDPASLTHSSGGF